MSERRPNVRSAMESLSLSLALLCLSLQIKNAKGAPPLQDAFDAVRDAYKGLEAEERGK